MMALSATHLTKPICSKCGSDNVVRDATASWNVAKQKWELAGDPCDQAYCEECGGETRLSEVPLYSGEWTEYSNLEPRS